MRFNEFNLNETTWKDIYILNQKTIKDPNRLTPGQTLEMPDETIYQVGAGDTLSGIAAGKRTGKTLYTSQGQRVPLAQPGQTNTPSPSPVGRSGPHPVAGKVAPVTAATGTGPMDIGNGVLVDPDMDPADIDALQTTKASAWPGEMWKRVDGKLDTVPVIPGKPRPYVAKTPTPQFHTPGAAHDGQQGQDIKNWKPEDLEQMRQDQIARIRQLAGTD